MTERESVDSYTVVRLISSLALVTTIPLGWRVNPECREFLGDRNFLFETLLERPLLGQKNRDFRSKLGPLNSTFLTSAWCTMLCLRPKSIFPTP